MIKDDTRKFKRTKNAADVQNAVERNSRKRFSLHRSAERCTAGSKRTTGKTEGGKGWKIVFVTPEFYVVSWEINVGQV